MRPQDISISEYDYELPQEKIAHYPSENRDDSKLLVFRGNKITDSEFKNLDSFLEPDTLLVFNNTRVIRARLKFGPGKPIEIFCLEPAAPLLHNQTGTAVWNCLVGNLRKWKNGPVELIADHIRLEAIIKEKKPDGVVVGFSWQPATYSFEEVLEAAGEMPIPPYLNRKSEEIDNTRYQTIFADKQGSVAAPTASLHFTGETMARLEKKGVEHIQITLHVGAGTFQPVKADAMSGHVMHDEWMEVSAESLQKLIVCERKIIAVGTTALRTIESLYWLGVKVLAQSTAPHELSLGQWEPYTLRQDLSTEIALGALLNWLKENKTATISCKTGILIAPPYQLKVAHGIITNFHQPRSTLLLLVSAIVGESWKDIYAHALSNDYRFLSYGDSSLLLK